jgi:hypothetical protein
MAEVTYNLNFLIQIKVKDKTLNDDFEWRDAVPSKCRLLFFRTKGSPAGFQNIRYGYTKRIFTAEELRSGAFKEKILMADDQEKKVYFYPDVELNFRDKYSFTNTFKTFEGAKKWAKEIQDKMSAGQILNVETDD